MFAYAGRASAAMDRWKAAFTLAARSTGLANRQVGRASQRRRSCTRAAIMPIQPSSHVTPQVTKQNRPNNPCAMGATRAPPHHTNWRRALSGDRSYRHSRRRCRIRCGRRRHGRSRRRRCGCRSRRHRRRARRRPCVISRIYCKYVSAAPSEAYATEAGRQATGVYLWFRP